MMCWNFCLVFVCLDNDGHYFYFIFWLIIHLQDTSDQFLSSGLSNIHVIFLQCIQPRLQLCFIPAFKNTNLTRLVFVIPYRTCKA